MGFEPAPPLFSYYLCEGLGVIDSVICDVGLFNHFFHTTSAEVSGLRGQIVPRPGLAL